MGDGALGVGWGLEGGVMHNSGVGQVIIITYAPVCAQ